MIRKIYEQYREVISYLFFGGLTFIVSMVSYAVFLKLLHDNALIANVFSWIFAVLFAYITNRIWVFQSENHGLSMIIKEMVSFFGGRIVTLIMEEVVLWIGISLFGMNAIAIKVIAQVLVVIGNYFISKFFVF